MTSVRPGAAVTAALVAAVATAGALTATPAHAVAGDTAPAGSYAFAAALAIGADETARTCTGSLVAPQWILTAASCFAADPETTSVQAGKPALKTIATVAGKTGEIVELVPRPGRDIVLARLARPTTGAAPVTVSATAATAGEQLKAVGYGRTRTEWVPSAAHAAAFTVDAVGTDDIGVTGVNGALCKGDTGGPLLRETNGVAQLVGVNSRSWQGGCFGEKETRTGAVASRSDDLATWVTTTVTAARPTDFNCDGERDIAVADPKAAVGADARAGVVRIVHGGGKGTTELNQDAAGVPGGAEPDDQFGDALAAFDHNLDGCTDLVVGVPGEDLGNAANAGMVQVLYGAPGGLTKGQTALTLEQGSGAGAIKASAGEAGDRMGHALAAGATVTGEPYLVIGVPGEDLGDVANAGNLFYLRGTTNASTHQDKPGAAGAAEKDDRFGTTVAGSPGHFAVGTPGEDVGTDSGSGGVQIYGHAINSSGGPTPLLGFDEDSDLISGAAEPGDQFGASLAMAEYRPSATSTGTESILAIGSPGEDMGTGSALIKDAGRVVTLRVDAAGKITQLADISQGTTGIAGEHEAGDAFGKKVVAVNTRPGAVSTDKSLLLSIGVPGEDIGSVKDAGAIRIVPLLGSPGASEVVVEEGKSGLPGAPGTSHAVGGYMTAAAGHLYVGMPLGPNARGALHALPWTNIVGGAADPVVSYQPGSGGLPAAGDTFGAVSQ
ncbi:trypsin-like serine protease [Streptomyces sp. MS2.AVA.5]|uniref:Trypsin-like serine protease n=1 Tax=Streptomyces achmelvichensis TaxID=3134111 RepID=A0ACC6PZF6_9ACTN